MITETYRSQVVYSGDNYDIVWFNPAFQRGEDYRGVPGMVAGRLIFVEVAGDWRAYRLGSAISASKMLGRCPIEAVDHARAVGHDLHWIEAATLPSAWAQTERELYAAWRIGEKIRFEGRIFTIVEHENNICLRDEGTGR